MRDPNTPRVPVNDWMMSLTNSCTASRMPPALYFFDSVGVSPRATTYSRPSRLPPDAFILTTAWAPTCDHSADEKFSPSLTTCHHRRADSSSHHFSHATLIPRFLNVEGGGGTLRASLAASTQASSTSGFPDDFVSFTSEIVPSSLKRKRISGGVEIDSGAMPAGKL